MAIHLLDKHTAELIAAGEVVERPASVVKELAENAIDAGASAVTVEIERGGVALIRVADNGIGIEAADLPLAFVRHATSKVRTQADLEAIETLGFRGEALASIASVARVEVLTKHDADAFASLYRPDAGPKKPEEAARPRGTSITVRELFYNTPARMKFLKKDASEANYVTETVTRLALSHPEVAFKYLRDGKEVFATPGGGELRGTVWAVLGAAFAKDLLQVDGAGQNAQVRGLVTPPRAGRASRSMQYFYINGRFVKNRTMMAALEQAYRGMALHGKFPGGVLFLEMPPALVDVNVHPAKTEVRFARESDIFDAVYRAVKAALLAEGAGHLNLVLPGAAGGETKAPARVPAGRTDGDPRKPDGPQVGMPGLGTGAAPRASARPQAPGYKGDMGQIRAYNDLVRQTAGAGQALESTTAYIPYTTARQAPPLVRYPGPTVDADAEVETRYNVVSPATDKNQGVGTNTEDEQVAGAVADVAVQEQEQDVPLPGVKPDDLPEIEAPAEQTMLEGIAPETLELRLVGEVFRTYIIAEAGDAMYLLDKHAAHERILYEKLDKTGAAGAQQLLAPQSVTLGADEKNALLQERETLLAMGLEVEDFGGNAVLVRAVPADIDPGDVDDLAVELAQRLAMNARDSTSDKREWVLHSMACRAAVKGGDKTPAAALLQLARQILAGEVPPFCPHGRPVVLKMTRKELEKQFGRLG